MGFWRFERACYKYQFSFVLSTYCGLTLMLRPHNTFENINLSEPTYQYSKLFNKAVKTMKEYRDTHGYR